MSFRRFVCQAIAALIIFGIFQVAFRLDSSRMARFRERLQQAISEDFDYTEALLGVREWFSRVYSQAWPSARDREARGGPGNSFELATPDAKAQVTPSPAPAPSIPEERKPQEAPNPVSRVQDRKTAAPASRGEVGPGRLIMPCAGEVTDGFGWRIHPIYRKRMHHDGIDIAASVGSPVYAAAGGRVSFAGPSGSYGILVELDHGLGLVTRYAHCSRVLVRPGDLVRPGQEIARVGNTGVSTGPHLHFEVLRDGRPINPESLLNLRRVSPR